MSSIKAVTVPRWGMTMTEGKICEWMVSEGDPVTTGQELIEIETTKITNVVEAPAEGILRRIVLATGTIAPVGALAGVIASATDDDAEIDAFVASYADRMRTVADDADTVPVPRTIDVRAGKVNLLESGADGGETIVFLHGFGGDLTTWLFNQPAFSETTKTIAFDLPGHGGSEAVEGDDAFSIIAEIMADAIKAVAPGRVHLVGHSFGGGIAAAVAKNNPQSVASLTLIAPIGLGKAIDQSFLSDFIAAERRRPLQGVLERLFADPSKITSDMIEGVLRFKRLEGVSQALGRIAQSIADEAGQRQSIASVLETLVCPVTVVWGRKDAIIPLPAASDLPANVVFETIAGAGHMPQMEAAAETNAAIAATIGRVS